MPLSLAAFCVLGRAGPGLGHSPDRSQGVKGLFCRPAECSWAGTSHAGASRPHPTGRSKGRGPPPQARGRGTCRLYCLLESPNALSMSGSLRRDLLPWLSRPFPAALPPKLPSPRQTSEPRCCTPLPGPQRGDLIPSQKTHTDLIADFSGGGRELSPGVRLPHALASFQRDVGREIPACFPRPAPSSPCSRARHPTGPTRSDPPGAPGLLPAKGSRQTHGHKDYRSTGMRKGRGRRAVPTGGLGTAGGRACGPGSAPVPSAGLRATSGRGPDRRFHPRGPFFVLPDSDSSV